jgi:hypothetical protein
MASITIVLRKDKINRHSKAPLHFRIVKNRKVTNLSSGIYIDPKFWDDENKRVRKSYQNSQRLNNAIKGKYLDLEDELIKLDKEDVNFSLKKLTSIIRGASSKDFISFAEKVVANYKGRGSKSNAIFSNNFIQLF